MTVQDLLNTLSSLGVHLRVEGLKLRYSAPAGVLSGELKENLKVHKAEIVAIMGGTPPPDLSVSPATPQQSPTLPFSVTEAQGPLEDTKAPFTAPTVAPHQGAAFALATALRPSLGHPLSGNPRDASAQSGSEEIATPLLDLRNLSAPSLSGIRLFELQGDLPEPARNAYREEILKRADAIIAESEGGLPPPNPTVHAMFEDARRCFRHAFSKSNDMTQCESPALPGVRDKAPNETDAVLKGRKMKVGGYFKKQNRLFRASDLAHPATLVIKDCYEEEVTFGNEVEKKLLLSFEGCGQQLGLNKTNLDFLIRHFGTDESNLWRGKKITLYCDDTVSFNGRTGAIRICEAQGTKGTANPNEDLAF